ncbi:MAG TPA: pitrilysin family protein, partial [Bacteroidota bacterium]|nr:pitrilysin family protein [Bacteroidota bacterium]
QFHSKYFHPNNAMLIVVGDINPKTIKGKLEKTFGKWKAAAVPKSSWTPAAQVKERKIWIVDKPGAAQSVIRIGRIGVQRLTEDYYPLVVLNTILGGSFTSRLNQNLREQHGYAYGAGSTFDFRPLPGPFSASASVQTDVTDKALTEFMKELTNIMQPVSDEELTRAKNYLALGYPSNFQSVAQIAGQLVEIVLYKLPDSYFNEYTSKILAVTKDDLNRVAKKYLDPERVNIIIVGDNQKIGRGVSSLKIAPVEHLSIDDVLGKAPVVEGGD